MSSLKTKRYLCALSFLFSIFHFFCHAQNINSQIKSNIEIEIQASEHKAYRGFIKKDKVKWRNYLPTRYIFGSLLFIYQNVISEQISADCAYEMSCSEFSKNSISKFGILKGVLLSGNRLSSCGPNTIIDFPEYKKSEQFKIAHDFEDY
jgi:uncharacterized protein